MPTNTITTTPYTYTTVDRDRMMAETILANTRELGKIRIGLLPLDLLFVDDSYQRPTRSRVKQIASHFDDNKCGFLLVSYRETESRFAIIDGGNRYEAAKLIGITALPCQILTGLSLEEEAAVFAAQNENRVRLTENDLLKAQVCAGDEIAIGFQNLCKEFGIKLYHNGQDAKVGTLVCVKTARRLYTEDADALRWAFEMICKANWNSISKGFAVYSIVPLYNLYQAHRETANEIENKLLAVMTQVAPTVLLSKALSTFIGHTRAEAMTSLLSCVLDGHVPPAIAAA